MEMTNPIVQFLMNFPKIKLYIILMLFSLGNKTKTLWKNLNIKQKFNNDKIKIKHTFVILNVC